MCSSTDRAAEDVDLHALSDAELLAAVTAAVAEHNRAAARLTRLVRVADARSCCEHDGLATMHSWLRTHTGMKPSTAAALVHRGRVLDLLPATAAAFAAGAIGTDHVPAIAAITTPRHLAAAAAHGVDLAQVDAALTTIATDHPHRELTDAVQHYLARLDPDGPEPDPVTQRSLRIATHPDGTLTLHAELDPVGGEKIKAVIEPIAAASRTAADDRTPAQIRGDAFVQWADTTLAAGDVPIQRTRKPGIAAVLDLADLVDPATGATTARMGFGATISAARARWLACDSTLARIVLGPDRQPLDRGREVRIVPAPLRQLLDLRDRGCVFTAATPHPDEGPLRPPPLASSRRAPAQRPPRPALRTAPRQGPPRLPDRPRSRRHLAHLAPRRHPDPPAPRAPARPGHPARPRAPPRPDLTRPTTSRPPPDARAPARAATGAGAVRGGRRRRQAAQTATGRTSAEALTALTDPARAIYG